MSTTENTTLWSKWMPPDPSSSFGESSREGQKLLSLIRSVETGNNDEDEIATKSEAALAIMSNLVAVYARKGLLRRDYQKAQQILGSAHVNAINNHQAPSKNKRSRRKEDKGLKETSLGASSTSTDESLLISALLRIFGLPSEKRYLSSSLVQTAADLCTSICNHLFSIPNLQSSTVAMAEYELMASSGSSILKALSKVNCRILSICSTTSQNREPTTEPLILLDADTTDTENLKTLQRCLRASACLIILLGIKLSRSSELIFEIQNVAWSALTLPNKKVQYAAARLLASVPLAGAQSGNSRQNQTPALLPAEQWSHLLMDSIVALSTILKTTAPVSRNMLSTEHSWTLSGTVDEVVSETTNFFRGNLDSSEALRVPAFRGIVDAVCTLIIAILAKDYGGSGKETSLLDARLPLGDILTLSEIMLSFSVASESLFYTTKKRLRLETIEGGLFSPTALACEISNYVKLSGHRIINILFSVLDGNALLPFSEWIMRMVSTALLSASSGALRKLVDPAFGTTQLTGKKRRWMHDSIAMRSEAVKTYTKAISLFGMAPSRGQTNGSSSAFSPGKTSDFKQSLTLVSGSLLEQLSWEGAEIEDWGTIAERMDLTAVAANCLEASLLCCGGFMPMGVRALLDSVAETGLKSIGSPDRIAANPSVQIAILGLACACLTTPWPDGTASSLSTELRSSCYRCISEHFDVRARAIAALQLCDSFATPRVPPLHTVIHQQAFASTAIPLSSQSLLAGMQQAKAQIEKERDLEDEVETEEERNRHSKRIKVDKEAKTMDVKVLPFEKNEVASEATQRAGPTNVPVVPKSDSSKPQNTNDSPLTSAIADSSEVRDSKASDNSDDGDDLLPAIVDDDGPDDEDL